MLRDIVIKNLEENHRNIVDRLLIYAGYIRSNISQAKLVDEKLIKSHESEIIRIFVLDLVEEMLKIDLDRPTGKSRTEFYTANANLQQEKEILQTQSINQQEFYVDKLARLQNALQEETDEKQRFKELWLNLYHTNDNKDHLIAEPRKKGWFS